MVEQHLPRGRGARHAVADADRRHALGNACPAGREGPDRRHDERVDAAVGELERELDLDRGIAVGIGDQELPAAGAEVALDARDELLQVEVGEAADDHADALGRAAAQRTCDRIGAEPELLGRGLHARLRLLGHLEAPQRIRHRGRREARNRRAAGSSVASAAGSRGRRRPCPTGRYLTDRDSGWMISETIHSGVSPGYRGARP